jgi:hypothetical protein
MTYFPDFWTMTFWLIYFMSLELKQIVAGMNHNSFSGAISKYVGFWNLLDLSRIAAILAYILVINRDDIVEHEKELINTFLILSSWFCSLEVLRLF